MANSANFGTFRVISATLGTPKSPCANCQKSPCSSKIRRDCSSLHSYRVNFLGLNENLACYVEPIFLEPSFIAAN